MAPKVGTKWSEDAIAKRSAGLRRTWRRLTPEQHAARVARTSELRWGPLPTTTCAVEGCDRPRRLHAELCNMHRQRVRKGVSLNQAPQVRGVPVERFWAKVAKAEGCWLWQAALVQGYGTFWNGERLILAHKFAYELLVGPVPDGLELDHLCRTPACVNPTHLEPVTHQENVRRAFPQKEKAA